MIIIVRVKNSGLAVSRSIESVSESAALRSGNQFSDLDFTTGLTELDTNALIRSVQDLINELSLYHFSAKNSSTVSSA